MIQRYVPSLIHIIATLIITRRILPTDFGEVALVMTFTQISSLLVASGLGEGLMYRVNNSQRMYSSVFYFNVTVAILLYLIFFLISGIISTFYEMPRLEFLVKIVCLNIPLYALSYIQRIQKQMQLKFQLLAVISFLASIIGSTVGIILSYSGAGVWSIVLLTLTINSVEMLLLWITSNWKPSLVFAWCDIIEIFPYSVKILFNNLVQVVYDNIYSLVIGKCFNAKLLGFFNRMQTVVYYTTTNFMYSIDSVFFPILCRRKNDRGEIEKAYEKLFRLSTLIAFPVLIYLIGLARQLITVILTENWIEGLPVLQLIATAFLFVPISYINNSFLKVLNRTDILLYSNIVKKIIGVFILIVTITIGFRAVCYGVIAYYFLDACISIYCSYRFLKIGIARQLSYIRTNVIFNIMYLLVLYFLQLYIEYDILLLFAGVFAGLVLFMSLHCILKTKEYKLVIEIVNNIR